MHSRRIYGMKTIGAYLDLLLGGGATQIFSIIQVQNLQVKFLVIFKSGEFLIFVVFFFFNLMPNPLVFDDFYAVLLQHLSVY
jgi:hypothetical protein